MLKLIPSARFAVGVHIGVGIFRVAVTNLYAEMVSNKISSFDLNTPAEGVLADIATQIDEGINECRIVRDLVIGVGIGASGLVNYKEGINVLAPRLGWHNVSIRQKLESALDLPVCVDNNVRTMALGEAFFGAGRGIDVLAFVYGRIGVGAGFVVNGHLFHGSDAGAGEVGHTIIIPQGGERCSCGNEGCLETLLSEPKLIKLAEQHAIENPKGLLAQYLASNRNGKTIERIFAAARDGDQKTSQMLEERARYLGIALANLVNVLNPELIILGGMFAQGQDLFIPKAEATMRETAFAGLGKKVKVLPTSFGWRAGVIGASSLALTTFFFQNPEG